MKQRNHIAIPTSDADHYLDQAEKRALNDILTSVRRKRSEEIASAIVDQLFRNGKSQAVRLVLALPNGKDGSSWGRGAVRDLILKHLNNPGE